ncbi:hypothetical protein FKW77_003034 [Venturia effusa]|uniref:F-box domain-containing protein n=1 Tax=Venturia effusa TaxID=50376 RepID=A0A517LF39_9PEZI|nr:hypothetical protein FKW77_003034 [Venturia effusa]
MADKPEASLLGIPVEIRQMILGYLLPDVDSVTWLTKIDGDDGETDTDDDYGGTDIDDDDGEVREVRPLRYGPLRQDREPCHPSILLVNHQIYDEGIGLLYNANSTYAIKIDYDEVVAFGEQLWSKWQVSPPPASEFALDSRLKRIQKVNISFALAEETWHEFPEEYGEPRGMGYFWFKLRMHALVSAMIRTAPFNEISICVNEERMCPRQTDKSERLGLELLSSFSRLHNLGNVHIDLVDWGDLRSSIEPESLEEEEAEASSRSKANQQRLIDLEQHMCSHKAPLMGTPLINVWFAALNLWLGNKLEIPSRKELREWVAALGDWLDAIPPLDCYLAMVDMYFDSGGFELLESSYEPRYGLQYESVIRSEPKSCGRYEHLETIFRACELRDFSALLHACRGLIVDWFRVRTIFYSEWRKGPKSKPKHKRLVKEAWDGLAGTMLKLKEELYEASQDCEPGSDHGGEIDAIFTVPEGFEKWDVFGSMKTSVAIVGRKGNKN